MAKIFISYSRKDETAMKRFVGELEETFIADGIFYDVHNTGGKPWWDNILEHIRKASVFVYLISNNSLASYACRAEYLEAMRLGKHIVPIDIADNVDLAYTDPPLAFILRKTHRLKSNQINKVIRTITDGLNRPNADYYRNTIQNFDMADVSGDSVNIGGTNNYHITYVVQGEQPIAEPAAGTAPPPQHDAPATSQWWGDRRFVIGAVMIPIVAAVIGGLVQISPIIFQRDTLAPAESDTSVAQDATLTIAEALAATQTVDASIFAETQAALDYQRQLDAAQTATAYAPTQEAIYQATLVAAGTATRAALLTLTPPATNTPPPTNTPIPPTLTNTPPPPTNNPDPFAIARTPITSNADWTPVERDFDGVTMVLVPAGSFEMGSSEEEIEFGFEMCQQAADNDAECQRSWFEDEATNGDNTQTFTEPFWIDRTEVTRAQYQQCVDAGVCEETPDSDYSSEPNQPINRVTWFQAQTYCEWRDGRLPTEAEWEYAARGPDRWLFPWGDAFNGDEANHCDSNCGSQDWASNFNYVNEENDDGHAITSPVGSYENGQSWVGAYDMAGNVWEWTSSLYEDYPYSLDHESNRDDNSARVLRGGGFSLTSNYLRSADRNVRAPVDTGDDFGFRCARS